MTKDSEDIPATLEDWLVRLKANEDRIFVREGGTTVALSGLTPERWGFHVAGWLERGVVPAYIRLEVLEELEKED